MKMRYKILLLLIGVISVIDASPKTFCPERCTCKKGGGSGDSSTGIDGKYFVFLMNIECVLHEIM